MKKTKSKKTVKRKKKAVAVVKRKKERMEPLGLRINKALRTAIEADAKKQGFTPSDVARGILENYYNRKRRK